MRTTYRKIEAMVDLSGMDVALRTDRGCQVTVMEKNARWITRVRILHSFVMVDCVLCVSDAGISLESAQKTSRDILGTAAVVQASAQISAIRVGVQSMETSVVVEDSHLAGRGLDSRTVRCSDDKSVSRTVYQPLVNDVEVGDFTLLMIVRQPVQFVTTAVARIT